MRKNKLTSKEAKRWALKGVRERAKRNEPGIEKQLLIKNYLEDTNLFQDIVEELSKQIDGEQKSVKAIFLSLCSIWLSDVEIPLNTMVSSESSAGKSYICKRIIKLFPKELVEYRSKITGEAFTYWKTNDEDWDWDGKICYLEDISQNVLDASTFKIMCSEGSIATVVRQQKAVDLEVKGKPMMLVTTARTNPNTEVLNRFQIVQLDESAKQTFNITRNKALQQKREDFNSDFTDAFRLLQRKKVYIPFAEKIHSYLAEYYTFNDLRMRRDFSRLLDLIRCSTTLHQFQREENEDGELVAEEADYTIAREIINYVSGMTFKGLVHRQKKVYDYCLEAKEFTAKDIHAKHPIVSLAQYYTYLNQLCAKELLVTELRSIEGSTKQVTFYKVPDKLVFNLPEFSSINSIIAKSGINAIKGINALNGSEQLKQLKQLKYISHPKLAINQLKCGKCDSSNINQYADTVICFDCNYKEGLK